MRTLSVEQILQRLEDRSASGRIIIGIAAAPGGGKSTLARMLAGRLADRCQVVPMDGFHLANEVLVERGIRQRKGAPDTFDTGGYAALLQRIRDQRPGDEPIYAPRFDRSMEEAISSAVPIYADTPIVLTEGNYLLLDVGGWERIMPLLDETWFLDVPAEIRRERLLNRRAKSGESSADSQQWVDQVDMPNGKIVTTSSTRADLVFRLRDWR